jgi:hypothetical protein
MNVPNIGPFEFLGLLVLLVGTLTLVGIGVLIKWATSKR